MTNFSINPLLCLLLIAPLPAVAHEEKASDVPKQFESLERQLEIVDEIRAAHQSAVEKDSRTKLWLSYVQQNDSVIPEILKVASLSSDSPKTFELLKWVVTNRRIHSSTNWPFGLQAVKLLREHHTANTNITQICSALGNNWDPFHAEAIEFLEIAAEKNLDRSARGHATLALARLTKEKAAHLELTNREDAQKLCQQAERLFERILEQYADYPTFSSATQPHSSIGDQAKSELHELRRLTIGKVAPEIEGEDLDGQSLKLSDFRGKVVVLSFWATWCGPCLEMIPQERSLVERMQGKPFVFLGINADEDRSKAKHAVEREKITWRSFWNGAAGADGPISTGWNIRSWPTVYVLDGHGVIRYKTHGFEGIEESVDGLIKELSGTTRAVHP